MGIKKSGVITNNKKSKRHTNDDVFCPILSGNIDSNIIVIGTAGIINIQQVNHAGKLLHTLTVILFKSIIDKNFNIK